MQCALEPAPDGKKSTMPPVSRSATRLTDTPTVYNSVTAPGFVPRSSGVNRVLSEVPIPDDRVMSRRRRAAVRTVRCTTCSYRRCSRGRLHVRTHPPRIRCRMTASVHICTARRRTPGGEAFAAGHRSRGICFCRWVSDWAATCNPLNRAFPDRTPYRSPCRAESHRAPTRKFFDRTP